MMVTLSELQDAINRRGWDADLSWITVHGPGGTTRVSGNGSAVKYRITVGVSGTIYVYEAKNGDILDAVLVLAPHLYIRADVCLGPEHGHARRTYMIMGEAE